MSVRNIVKSIQDIMRKDVGVDGDAQRVGQLCWLFFLKIIDDQDEQLELMKPDYASPIPERFRWRNWAADPEGMTGEGLITFVNDALFPALKALPLSGKPGDRRLVVRNIFEDAYSYMKSGQLLRQVVNKINEVDFNNLVERQHFGEVYEQLLNDLQNAGNAGEYYTPRAVTAFMVDRIDPKPGEALLDPACGTGGFLTCAIRHMRDRYVKRPEDEVALQYGLHAVEKKPLPHMLCVTNMLLHGVEDPSFVRHDNTLARPYVSYGQEDRVDIILTNPPFGGREEDGIESNFPRHFQTRETADLFLALIIRLLKKDGRAAVVLPDGSLFGEGVKTRLKEALIEECNLHTIVRLPNSVFRPYASIGTNLLFFEKGQPTKDIWYWEHRVPEGQKAYSMTRPIRLEHFADCIAWWGGASRQGREETPQAWRVTAEEVKARGYNLDIENPHAVEDDHGDPAVLLGKLGATEMQTAKLRDQLKAILAEAAARNAEPLLTHYERIAEAPDAIPRFRRFILDLAVRGKLVPQDPTDEPATELLKRIATKKARLARKERARREQRDPPKGAEVPQLPSGWAVAPLADLVSVLNGRAYKQAELLTSGTPVLRVGNLFTSDKWYYSTLTLDDDKYCENGDLIFAWSASFGPFIWSGEKVIYHYHIWKLPLHSEDDLEKLYIYNFLLQKTREIKEAGHGISMVHMTKEKMELLQVPVPPLAEQRRIVAKVNELMTLCDQLEASSTDTQATRSRLLDALLAGTLMPTAVRHETAYPPRHLEGATSA